MRNTSDGRQKLAKMHARLIDHQACNGTACFDPPHLPTPPPTPAAPVVRFQDPSSKKCLSYANDEKNMFALASCDSGKSGFVESTDENGFGQLRNPTLGQCLNIVQRHCDGGMVHLCGCQKQETKKVTEANHFHFDATPGPDAGVQTGQIVSEFCNSTEGGRCVDTQTGMMVSCTNTSATTWTRI
jgi:hypothetical protein